MTDRQRKKQLKKKASIIAKLNIIIEDSQSSKIEKEKAEEQINKIVSQCHTLEELLLIDAYTQEILNSKS